MPLLSPTTAFDTQQLLSSEDSPQRNLAPPIEPAQLTTAAFFVSVHDECPTETACFLTEVCAMQFEVQVPQPHHPGEFRKLVIEAPNWLLALRNGLKQVGDDNNVRNITCDIMDDEQIRVTDTKTGRIYEVRPAPKHQISPSSQPVAEAAAIVSAAALGGQTLAFDSPVFDFPIPSASSPDTLAARAEEVEPVVAPSATSRSAIENAQTITDDGSLQSALQARLAQQAPPPPSTTPEPEVPVFSAPLPPIDALSATPAIPPTTPSPALTAPKPPAEMTAVSMSDLAPQPPPAQPAASAFSSPPPAQPAAPAFSAPPPAQPVASAFSAPPPAQPVASAFSSPPPAQPVAPAFSAPPPA
ncbi:hypothetical protein L6R29_03260, partial [Myxococcota bacterium]|nr:hypothetical protein [Myxococcota bacterium]